MLCLYTHTYLGNSIYKLSYLNISTNVQPFRCPLLLFGTRNFTSLPSALLRPRIVEHVTPIRWICAKPNHSMLRTLWPTVRCISIRTVVCLSPSPSPSSPVRPPSLPRSLCRALSLSHNSTWAIWPLPLALPLPLPWLWFQLQLWRWHWHWLCLWLWGWLWLGLSGGLSLALPFAIVDCRLWIGLWSLDCRCWLLLLLLLSMCSGAAAVRSRCERWSQFKLMIFSTLDLW